MWEYTLKFRMDLGLISKLSKFLPLSRDISCLKQMTVMNGLFHQVFKSIDMKKTLYALEVL